MNNTVSYSSDRAQLQKEITQHMQSIQELTQKVLSSVDITTDNDDEVHSSLKEFMSDILHGLVSLNNSSMAMPSTIQMTRRMLIRTHESESEYKKLQEIGDKEIDKYILDYFEKSINLVSSLNHHLSIFTEKSPVEDINLIVDTLVAIEQSSKVLLVDEVYKDEFSAIVCCSDEAKLNKLLGYMDILENTYVSAKNAIEVIQSNNISGTTKISKLNKFIITEFSDILGDSNDSVVEISKICDTVYAVTNYKALVMTGGQIVIINKNNDSVVDSFNNESSSNKSYYIPM